MIGPAGVSHGGPPGPSYIFDMPDPTTTKRATVAFLIFRC